MSDFESALQKAHTADAPLFAVLDGAQFDDLPESLLLGDFVAQPLYLDRGDNDPQQVITAPHLVWLDEQAKIPTGREFKVALSTLLALVGDRAAAVFWQCPAGGDALYKHLRGINMVRYPKEALEDWEEPEVELEEGEIPTPPDTHTMVTFRHADANVMVQMLGSMGEAELSRLYGPATGILFHANAEWAGAQSFTAMPRSDAWPPPPPGPLEISMPTLGGLDTGGEIAAKRSVKDYLRDVSPEYCEDMTEEELDQLVETSRRTGAVKGFETEYGMALWAFTLLITDMGALDDPEINALLASPQYTPDRALELMLDQTQRQM